MGGCEKVRNVIVYKRTGSAVAMLSPRDKWWHQVVEGQADTCEPTWVNAEHPLFILYTSGSTGKPKGVQHSTGGYLLQAMVTMKWMFDSQAHRRLLVHGGRRLGHRPYLHHVRSACLRCDRDHVRGRADLSRRRPVLEDDPGPQGHGVLHRADGDPLAHQGRRRSAEQVRSLEPAHPRHRRRADQSRGVDLVLQDGRQVALPDRRYLVADRDRRPHDHAAPGRDGAQAGLLPDGAPRDHGRHRRRDGPGGGEGQGRDPGDQAAVAGDDPDDLGRSGALPEELLPGGLQGQVLPRRRRREPRPERQHHHHGPDRRRAERFGSPARHDGGRVGARRQPARRRGRRRRSARTI